MQKLLFMRNEIFLQKKLKKGFANKSNLRMMCPLYHLKLKPTALPASFNVSGIMLELLTANYKQIITFQEFYFSYFPRFWFARINFSRSCKQKNLICQKLDILNSNNDQKTKWWHLRDLSVFKSKTNKPVKYKRLHVIYTGYPGTNDGYFRVIVLVVN